MLSPIGAAAPRELLLGVRVRVWDGAEEACRHDPMMMVMIKGPCMQSYCMRLGGLALALPLGSTLWTSPFSCTYSLSLTEKE